MVESEDHPHKDSDIKNIVVFGANGGIGQDLVRRLSEAVADGKPYRVTIISRKGDVFGEAQLKELRESFDNKAVEGDLAANLVVGPVFDPKHLEYLEETLKNADMVVCAAGLPRPNPAPPRSALIYPNAPVVKDVATAMARYAKAETVLLLGTNPLDNTVKIADFTLRQEWDKLERGNLPDVKVIGMSGNLDGARLQIYAAEILNKALCSTGKGASSFKDAKESGKIYVRPKNIEGHVYGQHGDGMVVDVENATVFGIPVSDFINKYNMADEKIDFKGDKFSIKKAIEKYTIDGGAAILRGLERTTQIGGAGQIVRMIEDYFGSDKKKIEACVVHDGVASGRPVEIGGEKIDIVDYPRAVTDNTILMEAIKTSREIIKNDDEYYDKCVAAEGRILSVVNKGDLSISREVADPKIKTAQDLKKTAQDLKVEITATKGRKVTSQQLADIKNDLAFITKATNATSDSNTISFVVKSNSTAPLDTLAEALGATVNLMTAQPSADVKNVDRFSGVASRLPDSSIPWLGHS